MKKGFLMFCLAAVVAFGSLLEVKAYSSYYLPGGTNYLSEENFVLEGNTYSSVSPFLVKTYTSYTMTVPKVYMELNGSRIDMLMYDDEISVSQMSIEIDEMSYYDDGNEQWYSYTFMTPGNGNYLSVTFIDMVDYFDNLGFSGFQLEEGTVFTGYEPYVPGDLVDATAPYFIDSGIIISYYDSPMSVVDIQSGLIARDDIDGDVTGNITLVEDNYTPNIDVLGLHDLVFEVFDSSGNISQITIQVNIVDALKPVFSQLATIEAVYPNVYTTDDILAMMSASDNYDGDISNDIVMVSDDYSSNADRVGVYQMEFEVTDSSGNTAHYIQDIEVVDNDGPIFSGITTVIVGYDALITPETVLSNLACTDNYDQTEDLSIQLVSDDYTSNHYLIGQYEIVFSATDKSLNTSYQTVIVTVVDDIGPVVYFDSSIIQTYTDSVMSLPDFTALLVNANELDRFSDYLVTVRYDSYTKNAMNPGVYHLTLDFQDEEGLNIEKNLEIRVVDKEADFIQLGVDTDDTNVSFIEKYRQYIIPGAVGFTLLISNVVLLVIIKKRR